MTKPQDKFYDTLTKEDCTMQMNKSKLNEEWNISAVRIPPLSIETASNPGFKINLKWFHRDFCMCLLREAGYFWKKKPQTSNLGKTNIFYIISQHEIINFINSGVIFLAPLNIKKKNHKSSGSEVCCLILSLIFQLQIWDALARVCPSIFISCV